MPACWTASVSSSLITKDAVCSTSSSSSAFQRRIPSMAWHRAA
ncbi:hypothetical protein [Streptomyces sp. NPDC016626]